MVLFESNVTQIVIQPNPSKGRITISNLEPGSILKIYSILGECIFTTFSEQDQIELDIHKFQNGIYLIQNGHSRQGKFVKIE